MPSSKNQVTEAEVQGWGMSEVSEWLKSAKLESCIEEFQSLQIDGQRLLLLTWDEFKTLESMKEEKKKKLLKKALGNLPGRVSSSATKKGKKAGSAQKKGNKSDLAPPNPAGGYSPAPVGGYPPSGAEAPALPPRPGRGGPLPPPPSSPQPPSSNYRPSPNPPRAGPPPNYFSQPGPPLPSSQPPPLPSSQPPPLPSSQPPPLPTSLPPSRMPGPPSMRPSLPQPGAQPPGYPGQFQDTLGYQDEGSEDIYDAVPDENQQDESEDIYDDGNIEEEIEDDDSFDDADDDDEIEDEYEESATIQQQMGINNKADLTALKAKFYVHGIGTLDGRHFGGGATNEEPIDDEIYDLPPEGEIQSFQPAPPPMAPPPPMGPPPDQQPIDDEIYDCAPEGAEGMTQDDFGYGDNEDIYDIADEDMTGQGEPPPVRPPVGGPSGPPGVSIIRPPIRPPQGQPPPVRDMPRPPLNPPEDEEGEDIYDCMEENEEPQVSKPPAPSFGMRPPMRQPIDSVSPPVQPKLRPPINPTVADVKNNKLQSTAFQQAPPRPGSGSKPTSFQEIQQSKLHATSGQAPPLRPPSSTKPPAVPPPPPTVAPPVEGDDDDDSGASGGGLANELAAMKKRLRAGSNATPPIERKSSSFESSKPSPVAPPSPAPPSSGGSADLASSIAMARNRLRSGTGKEISPKAPDGPQKPKFEFPKPSRNEPELHKKATPPSSPKPPHVPKPSIAEKPQPPKPPKPGLKPVVAPKGKRVAALTGKFLDTGEKDVGGSGGGEKKSAIELDRSPLTGRKVDRKQSVKELTQRYSSPESGEEASPSHEPSVPPKVGGDPPGNAAMNIFKRKQMEAESGATPPPKLPGKQPAPPPTSSPFNKAPPSPGITAHEGPKDPFKRGGGEQPPLPGRFPPGDNNSDAPRLPNRPRPPLPDGPDKPPPQQNSAPPLPGRPLPQHNNAPSLPGRPLPQQNSSPPLPGRSLPQQNNAPSLPGRPLPQQNNAPPLPGRPLPQQTNAPSLPGRPLPQQNDTPSLPGRPRPQSNNAPPLGRPPPQQDSAAPPLPGRPRLDPPQFQEVQQSAFKPPLRSPIEEPPLPKKATGLSSQSWYHSTLDRKNAEAKIKRYSKDGTFIVRDNTRNPGEYSLSLWHDGGVRHLRIRKRADKQFVLGEEKADKQPFKDVIELVTYYKEKEPVVLKSGGQTFLKYECPH